MSGLPVSCRRGVRVKGAGRKYGLQGAIQPTVRGLSQFSEKY